MVSGCASSPGWAATVTPGGDPSESLARLCAEISPDGPDHHPVIVEKLLTYVDEPTSTASDVTQVRVRTLVMIGDDDEVALEHAITLNRGLLGGELAVIPATSHGLPVEKAQHSGACWLR